MAERSPFSVSVVTPARSVFDGDAEMIVVPGEAGEIGVLARHVALEALLKAGSIRGQSNEYSNRYCIERASQNISVRE